ncbi:hypothetical protein ACFLWY_02825 [Chloroflexota bacterium]
MEENRAYDVQHEQENIGEESIRFPNEADITEVASQAFTEQYVQEGDMADRASETPPPQKGDQTRYVGQVDLVITPASLSQITKFFNYLQTIPDLRVLYIVGSWDEATTMTLAVDQPMALMDILSKSPGVEVGPMMSQKETSLRTTIASLRGARRIDVRAIKVILTEE